VAIPRDGRHGFASFLEETEMENETRPRPGSCLGICPASKSYNMLGNRDFFMNILGPTGGLLGKKTVPDNFVAIAIADSGQYYHLPHYLQMGGSIRGY
jgi:hypothetical protein